MTPNNTSLIADMLRQSMANGQMPFLTISSNSMAPLLKTGDQVGLEAVEPGQLRAGDIITLVQGGHLLTHRFWGLDAEGRLHTRGDRPLALDAPGNPDQLLGRIVVRRRQNRELLLHTGAGRQLNRHLVWLVRVESRLLTGHVPSPTAPPLPPQKQRRWAARLVRRFFLTWARLVVGIFG
jgi:hypothetical protein